MSYAPTKKLEEQYQAAYLKGFNNHGDLELDYAIFVKQLTLITEKYLGDKYCVAMAVPFIKNLHTCDLYLSLACAQQRVIAWNRFMGNYQKHILELANFVSRDTDRARELATSTLSDMFLPDRSGRSRISSYDGRSTLLTWLRVIINNRAINERKNKNFFSKQLENTLNIPDHAYPNNIEVLLRTKRYEHIVSDTFYQACKTLTKRERLLILMRYEDELQLHQIARFFNLHPSTIMRQLEKVQIQLRKNIISILTLQYRLTLAAVEECLASILENSNFSILTFIRANGAVTNMETSSVPIYSIGKLVKGEKRKSKVVSKMKETTDESKPQGRS